MKIRKDHIFHFVASAFGMLFGYYLMTLLRCPFWPCIAGGILFGLGLGLGKEIGDMFSPGNKFDITDIVADLLGLIAGSIVILLLWLINTLIY